MHATVHIADVVVMASFDVVQPKSVIFQNLGNIVERSVEHPLGHTQLHTRNAEMLNLDGRRDGFI